MRGVGNQVTIVTGAMDRMLLDSAFPKRVLRTLVSGARWSMAAEIKIGYEADARGLTATGDFRVTGIRAAFARLLEEEEWITE